MVYDDEEEEGIRSESGDEGENCIIKVIMECKEEDIKSRCEWLAG